MDTSYERTLHGGLNPGWTRTLSRLDDVGADVRLKARFTDLADEDVDSAEGDPVPYSIEPASGPQPASSM